jgi:hypothetical protein
MSKTNERKPQVKDAQRAVFYLPKSQVDALKKDAEAADEKPSRTLRKIIAYYYEAAADGKHDR